MHHIYTDPDLRPDVHQRARVRNLPKIRELMVDAGIPSRYLDVTIDTPIVAAKLAKSIEIWLNVDKPPALFLAGNAGLGKTLCSVAYCRELLLMGYSCQWCRVTTLASELRETQLTTGSERIDELCKVNHLFLDDLTVCRITDWWFETLYNIISRRFDNLRPVTVTLNSGENDAPLEARIARRLAEDSIQLEFK